MPEQGVPCNSRGRVDHRSRPPPRPRAHSRMVKSRVWRKSHHISFFNPDAPPNPPGPFTRLRQWSTQAETTRTHRLYYIQVPPPLPAPAVVFTIPIPPPHPPTPPRITFLWASRRNRFPTRFNTGLRTIFTSDGVDPDIQSFVATNANNSAPAREDNDNNSGQTQGKHLRAVMSLLRGLKRRIFT